MSTKHWTIGVDPGQQGGLSLIDDKGQAIEYERMPNIKGIDEFFFNAYIAAKGHGATLVCAFEEHKGGGPKTNANTHRSAGYYLGIFKTVCAIRDVPLHMVTPQEWKGLLKLTLTRAESAGRSYEERRELAKEKSINAAECLFPNVNLTFPRCTKKHDGVAEALLIAEWGRQRGL